MSSHIHSSPGLTVTVTVTVTVTIIATAMDDLAGLRSTLSSLRSLVAALESGAPSPAPPTTSSSSSATATANATAAAVVVVVAALSSIASPSAAATASAAETRLVEAWVAALTCYGVTARAATWGWAEAESKDAAAAVVVVVATWTWTGTGTGTGRDDGQEERVRRLVERGRAVVVVGPGAVGLVGGRKAEGKARLGATRTRGEAWARWARDVGVEELREETLVVTTFGDGEGDDGLYVSASGNVVAMEAMPVCSPADAMEVLLPELEVASDGDVVAVQSAIQSLTADEDVATAPLAEGVLIAIAAFISSRPQPKRLPRPTEKPAPTESAMALQIQQLSREFQSLRVENERLRMENRRLTAEVAQLREATGAASHTEPSTAPSLDATMQRVLAGDFPLSAPPSSTTTDRSMLVLTPAAAQQPPHPPPLATFSATALWGGVVAPPSLAHAVLLVSTADRTLTLLHAENGSVLSRSVNEDAGAGAALYLVHRPHTLQVAVGRMTGAVDLVTLDAATYRISPPRRVHDFQMAKCVTSLGWDPLSHAMLSATSRDGTSVVMRFSTDAHDAELPPTKTTTTLREIPEASAWVFLNATTTAVAIGVTNRVVVVAPDSPTQDARGFSTNANPRDDHASYSVVALAGLNHASARVPLLAAATDKGSVLLLDADKGVRLREFLASRMDEFARISIAWAPSGEWIACSCVTSVALCSPSWSDKSRAVEWDGHSGSVRSVAFAPDSSKVFSASFDRTVRAWELLSPSQTP